MILLCLPAGEVTSFMSELQSLGYRTHPEKKQRSEAKHYHAERIALADLFKHLTKNWYSFHWKLSGVYSSAFRKKNNMVDLGKLCRDSWDGAKHKVESKVLKCHSQSSSCTYEILWWTVCDLNSFTVLQWGFSETMCFIFIANCCTAHTLPVLHREQYFFLSNSDDNFASVGADSVSLMCRAWESWAMLFPGHDFD